MLYLPDSRKVSIPTEIPSTLSMPTKESSFSSVAVRRGAWFSPPPVLRASRLKVFAFVFVLFLRSLIFFF
jgi:hypothetical protein